MNKLLELFDNSPKNCQGFEDDATQVTAGLDLNTVVSLAQKAINDSVVWATEQGVEFLDEKTKVLLFTTKLKYKSPRRLKIYGKEISYSTHAKYLGIWIDNKLLWNIHVTETCKSAKMKPHDGQKSHCPDLGSTPRICTLALHTSSEA
jgi:hypothetical protein